MTWLHALLLGILEGLTEFLPVSSTGHLYLFGALLGHEDDATKALDVVMQLGAVIAVVIFYRARLVALIRGIFERDLTSLRLLLALVIGFLPAAVIGLAVHKKIKSVLMAPRPIAAALITGGLLMIALELVRKRGDRSADAEGLDKVTPKRALIIGLAQCFSLWPGASRSMSTIVGGQVSGLSTSTAAEFSFFLAIPTLGAATLFDLLKHGKEILAAPGGATALGVSMVTSFVVSFVVMAAFLRYLKRFGLAPFGVYRVVFGTLVLVLMGGVGATPEADRPNEAAPVHDTAAR